MTKKISFSKVYSGVLLGVGLLVMTVLVMAAPSSAKADTLYRQLQVGMSGSDVGSLQTFLAQDKTLYPQGLVTNYFGFLTKSAVANFQSRNGIPAVGRVGPATLPVLNAQMSGGLSGGGDIYAPAISGVYNSVSNNSATVSWATNEPARGVVHYSNVPLTASETLTTVSVSGLTAMSDTALRNSQSITIPNLMSNTLYYYMVDSTDNVGNVNVTWPATFHTN